MSPEPETPPPSHAAAPLHPSVPPSVVATPHDVVPFAEGEIRWWRPSCGEVCRKVGWRWLLLTPALGLILLWVATWYLLIPDAVFYMLEIKLLIFCAAIAISMGAFVARTAIRARREPFCIYCGYCLEGLPDNYRCPECGRPYTWALIDEYRRDPHWFIERWRRRSEIPPADAPFAAGEVRSKPRRDGT